MAWADIVTFVLIASLLVISPGPNGVLIAKTVPTSGRVAGLANVAGFITAFYLHGALSILGISLILVQSAIAFAVVKYLGAAYLFWIGAKALYTAIRTTATKQIETAPHSAATCKKRPLLSAYIEGFLTNALNPKVSMFYLAAFPQFITGANQSVTSYFLLVFLHSAINAVWFGAMVLLVSQLATLTRKGAFQRWLTGATGVVFTWFGIKLASYRITP